MISTAELLEWLSKPENLIPTIAAPVFLAILFWVSAKARSFLLSVFRRFHVQIQRARKPIAWMLRIYRHTLDEQTFQIQHAWMKEGQTLDNILVPVVIESGELAGGIEEWSIVLRKFFGHSEDDADPGLRRLAVIGGPGSGKSVALKVAAREAWQLFAADRKETLIPVFLTFGDYRHNGYDLTAAIRESFVARGLKFDSRGDGKDEMEEFVEGNLSSGRILVIVDGLDELDRDDRKKAAARLVVDLGRFQDAPAIFSCRKAAWRGQFSGLRHHTVTMGDYTPAAIRRFVLQWDFAPPKSGGELLETIQSQPHIAELAQSPLMLTIIAFLYSQPKYHLPENRAAFYDICSRALLEEWDQHRNPDQANRFERHHKESVLSSLAYGHLRGQSPESDLDERQTLDAIAGSMKGLSLKPSENLKMLDEIRENSGLLMRLPPSGLRFPHQTFLEFFAALHLKNEGDQDVLFHHFDSDPERWREVVLLYVGLTTNSEDTTRAVARLQQAGSLELSLAALSDARAVKPEVAGNILSKCEAFLNERLSQDIDGELPMELITRLGHVASNGRAAHADQASEILRYMLSKAAQQPNLFSPQVLECLLLASMRRPTEETSRLVVENIEDLQLGRLLPQMGERAFILSAKIIGDANLAEDKKEEWIDGLRRAEGIQPLLELITRQELSTRVYNACVMALVRLSGTPEFQGYVDTWNPQLNIGDPESEVDVNRWGWPFDSPSTEAGRWLMKHLADRAATMLELDQILLDVRMENCDERLQYLAAGLRVNRQPKEAAVLRKEKTENSLQAFSIFFSRTAPSLLRAIWKKGFSTSWQRWTCFFLPTLTLATVLSLLFTAVFVVWTIVALIFADSSETSCGIVLTPTCILLSGTLAITVLWTIAELVIHSLTSKEKIDEDLSITAIFLILTIFRFLIGLPCVFVHGWYMLTRWHPKIAFWSIPLCLIATAIFAGWIATWLVEPFGLWLAVTIHLSINSFAVLFFVSVGGSWLVFPNIITLILMAQIVGRRTDEDDLNGVASALAAIAEASHALGSVTVGSLSADGDKCPVCTYDGPKWFSGKRKVGDFAATQYAATGKSSTRSFENDFRK